MKFEIFIFKYLFELFKKFSCTTGSHLLLNIIQTIINKSVIGVIKLISSNSINQILIKSIKV